MKKILIVLVLITLVIGLVGCDRTPSSDQKQQEQQEKILQEGTSQLGMPAVHNFAEKRLLKQIIEQRDQNIPTYTYLFNEMTGKPVFLAESIGYGIPAATQYTNPQKIAESRHEYGYAILPQADPNGTFSPQSAEGTWILLKDPNSKEVKPVYIEPRVIVSPFKLN